MSNISEVKKLIIENSKDIYSFGVYKISNIINNKCYIGSTIVKGDKNCKGFIRRWCSHYGKLVGNKHHSKSLQNFANKYGVDKLRFEVVEICEEFDCRIKEQYWIDTFNSFKDGFNDREKVDLTLTGEGNPRYIKLDESKIIFLYNNYFSTKEIGDILNVSKNTINRCLVKNNIDIESKYKRLPIKEIYYRFRLGGETITELSKEFKVSRNLLGNLLKENGYSILKEDYIYERLEDIQLHINNGKTLKNFCYKTPINYTHVCNILNYEEK